MGKLHIALTFDDRYWAPAYATARSICLYTFRRADLVFHLFHQSLSAAHQDEIRDLEREFGATLHFLDLDQHPLSRSLQERVPRHPHFGTIVYARLLFPQLLPPDVDRLLFVDCDVLVRRSIETIAEMDLAGHALAAAPDHWGARLMAPEDMRDERGLFDIAQGYFNAGVLVIDLEAWRKAGLVERLDAMIADGTLNRIYQDQDFLNIVFARRWLELDGRWNFGTPRKMHEVLHPYLVHYSGRQKPWLKSSEVAFGRDYVHAMTRKILANYAAEQGFDPADG